MADDKDGAMAAFLAATNADDDTARAFLERYNWNPATAAARYFSGGDDGDAPSDEDMDDEPAAAAEPPHGEITQASSSRAAASSSAGASRPKQKTKFASLRDLQARDDDGDDDEPDKEQQYFAGGDKSGLAVQDPGNGEPRSANDHIQRLLQTARQNAPRPGAAAEGAQPAPPRPSNFTGSGVTLGGDDTPSRVIPSGGTGGTPSNTARPPAMVERTLHLWNDGFSVDDGELYRYDDPANARTLDMINRGSAPLELMGVAAGQAVDVKLETHRNENYVRPKKKYRPFDGTGQRLGAEVPNAPTSSSATSVPVPTAAAGTAPTASTTSTAAAAPPTVDASLPTLTLQIRLADGTRLPTRFNTGATVGDVYAFVGRANTASSGRAYTLASTFPTKELLDHAAVLGEMAEFKRGGTVVQKWS